MPILNIPKTYQDGNVLNESDLDNILDSIEAFVNTTKLDSDNLQDAAVGAAQIATNAVVEAKINTGAVTENKIAASSVTTTKIAANAVTEAKLSNHLIESISSDQSISTSNNVGTYLVTTASDNVTLTLPAASDSSQRELLIKKVDSGVGNVVVQVTGSDVIDGASDLTIYSQYDVAKLLSNGTSWNVLEAPEVIQDLELDNNFTAGIIRVRKKGKLVTIILTELATFTSNASPRSSSDFLATEFRPPQDVSVIYNAAGTINRVRINDTGRFDLDFLDFSGSTSSKTDSGGFFTISYLVD